MAATESTIASAEVQSGVSVIIERSPEQIFAALTDVASHTTWARGPEEILNVSENPARLGTTWQQVVKMLGKRIAARMEVNAYEEKRKFGFGTDKPFPMDILFSLTPVAGGTEVRITATGQPASIFGKVALPVMAKGLERQMESDLYNLKGILEEPA